MSDDEFTLGEDVTSLARSKSRGGTVVVSVRLSLEELAAVEMSSRESGKTISQVMREALRRCLRTVQQQPSVTVSFKQSGTTTTGSVGPTSRASWSMTVSNPDPEVLTV